MNKHLKYCGFLLLLCLYHFAGAQVITEDTTTNQPFFAAKKFDSKCYLGFEGTATQILKKKAGMTLGLSLNWVINHKFVVSAKYYGLTTPLNIKSKVLPDNIPDTINLTHHFAGVGFSYILFDKRKFSLQPELTVGWAVAKFKYQNRTYRRHLAEIIPALYGVFNVSKYFRFGLGLNYRAVVGKKINNLTGADLSGVGGVLFVRVGTF